MTVLAQISWPEIAIACVWVMIVAGAGGRLTEIGAWYEGLRFPGWRPPNWLFAPAWTLIFLFVCASSLTAWTLASAPLQRGWLLVLLLINSTLNIAWSYLFFRLRRPDWALIELICLEISILVLVIFTWRISPLSGILMLPYLAWVAFAAFLNREMVRLNAPFESRQTEGDMP